MGELFVERGKAVDPRFSIDEGEDRVVAEEICQRLDGIPLAIELAASRMASMSPTRSGTASTTASGSCREPAGVSRGIKRSVTPCSGRTTCSPSMNRRCSIAALSSPGVRSPGGGGCDRGGRVRRLDLLGSLVRKSLITAERVATGTRYSMLETIRQFAEERLAASGLSDEARDLHAHHFAAMERPVMELWNSLTKSRPMSGSNRHGEPAGGVPVAAQGDDLDMATGITVFAAVGSHIGGSSTEPISWAKVLPGALRARHELLLALYQVAAWSAFWGRPEEGVAVNQRRGDHCTAIRLSSRTSTGSGRAGPPAPMRTPCQWIGGLTRVAEVLGISDDPLLAKRSLLAIALASTGHTDRSPCSL